MEFLPTETLNSIMEFIQCFEIGRLLISGSKLLRQKLMGSGEMKTISFFNWRHGWPSLVAQLPHLEHFVLTTESFKPPFIEMVPNFSALSRKLKTLKTSVYGAASGLESLLEKDVTFFDALETLQLSGKSIGEDQELDLLSKMRNLTSIRIFPSSDRFPALNLRSLPPNLATLDIRTSCLQVDDDLVRFPGSLTTLRLFLTEPCRFIHLLPPNLTTLTYEIRRIGQNFDDIPLDDFLLLPKTISELSLPCSDFGPAHAEILPSCIQDLRIVSNYEFSEEKTMSILKALPKTMKSIRGIYPSVMTAALASLLPRTLSQFLYVDIEWDAVHLLPSQLRSLYLVEHGSPPEILGLPSCLEAFNVEMASPSVFAALPPDLPSFSIRSGKLSLEMVKKLPSKLEYFSISENQPFDTLECWKYLPRALKNLDITPSSLNEEDIDAPFDLPDAPDSASWFPPDLQTLAIGLVNKPSNEWFSYLPRQLEVFCIYVVELPDMAMESLAQRLLLLTDLDLYWTKPQPGGIARFIPYLPRSLEYCVLSYSKTEINKIEDVESEATDEHLKNLPRNLRNLLLPLSPKLTEECTRYMPRALEELRLGEDIPAWFTKWNELKYNRPPKASFAN
jgi:hypothetical protein